MQIPGGRGRAAATASTLALLLATAARVSAQNPVGKDTAQVSAADTATKPPPPLAPPPPPPAPKAQQTTPTVRLSGVAYAQFEYWASDSVNHTNQFDVTRAYVNAIGTFEHGVSTRITADVFRNSAGASSLLYRLKYAYFQWLPSPGANVDFRFGMTQTPWIDWEEGLYGFRMQGTMPMERAGYLSSSDLGLTMDYFAKDKGLLNGSVGVFNGEFYSNAPGGKFLDYEARGSLRLLKSDDPSIYGGLRLSGYAGIGRIDNIVGGKPRNRYVAMLSYKSKVIILAGQADFAKTGQPFTTSGTPPVTVDTIPDFNARQFAGYGIVSIPNSAVQLLARVDYLDPRTDRPDDASTRFIAGIAYKISPNLRVLGDIDAVKYQDNATALKLFGASTYLQRTKLLFQTEFTF